MSRIMGVVFGGVGRIVGVILLIFGIVYGILPNVRNDVNERVSSITHTIKNWISPDLKQARPVTTTANTAVKGHPASFATDGIKNNFWLANTTKGQARLHVVFGSKINLKEVIVHNGASGDNVKYTAYARPQKLHFVFDTQKTADVNLDDKPDSQTHNVSNGGGITSIDIFIPQVYKSPVSNAVALTEIEFFREA